MKTIKNLTKKNLAGKTAIVRVDFNVPLKGDKVAETFRIDQTWPTIDYLLKNKAKVLLVSHLGDDGQISFAPVVKFLNRRHAIKLASDFASAKDLLAKNDLVILENLRCWPGEKNNDPLFAKELAALGDIYVNEAFSVSHRRHASVVSLPKYLPSYAGLRLVEEEKNLKKLLTPKLPFVVILGGDKFQTKIPLIKKLAKAEKIFLGGALANSFFKAKGFDVGRSVADGDVSYIKPFLKKKNIVLPLDILAVDSQTGQKKVKLPNDLLATEAIFDVGPKTLVEIVDSAQKAKTILWNGPLGWFEKGYKQSTLAMAKNLTGSKAFTVLGGGDTLAAIKQLKLADKFSFVSTGGGAMLDYIASGGKLPGLQALEKSKKS